MLVEVQRRSTQGSGGKNGVDEISDGVAACQKAVGKCGLYGSSSVRISSSVRCTSSAATASGRWCGRRKALLRDGGKLPKVRYGRGRRELLVTLRPPQPLVIVTLLTYAATHMPE